MKEPRSSKKIRLSRQQYDRLRIIYAVVLAAKNYGLDADTLFIHGLNPGWIAQHDVLSITTNLHDENKMLNQLFETGKVGDIWQKGFMWFRKTKRGLVAYIPHLFVITPAKRKTKSRARKYRKSP